MGPISVRIPSSIFLLIPFPNIKQGEKVWKISTKSEHFFFFCLYDPLILFSCYFDYSLYCFSYSLSSYWVSPNTCNSCIYPLLVRTSWLSVWRCLRRIFLWEGGLESFRNVRPVDGVTLKRRDHSYKSNQRSLLSLNMLDTRQFTTVPRKFKIDLFLLGK